MEHESPIGRGKPLTILSPKNKKSTINFNDLKKGVSTALPSAGTSNGEGFNAMRAKI